MPKVDSDGRGLGLAAIAAASVGIIPILGILTGFLAMVLGIVSLLVAGRREPPGNWFYGALGLGLGSCALAWNLIGVPIVAAFAVPHLLETRQATNEAAAVAALKTLAVAETAYQRGRYNGGSYANDPGVLAERQLIETQLSDSTNGQAYQGYHFFSIETRDGRPLDTSCEFAYCAVPSRYGASGGSTYVVTETGIVLMKDNLGNPVVDLSEVDGTWTNP